MKIQNRCGRWTGCVEVYMAARGLGALVTPNYSGSEAMESAERATAVPDEPSVTRPTDRTGTTTQGCNTPSADAPFGTTVGWPEHRA